MSKTNHGQGLMEDVGTSFKSSTFPEYTGVPNPVPNSILPIFQSAQPANTGKYFGVRVASRSGRRSGNPYGYNRLGMKILREGWDCEDMKAVIRHATAKGFNEMFVWHIQGYHKTTNHREDGSMPDWVPGATPQAVVDSWHRLREWIKINFPSFKLSIYNGPTVSPNFGTLDDPKFEWLTIANLQRVIDKYEDLIDTMQPDGFCLDAFNWIMSYRDEPVGKNWNDTEPCNPGDSEIPREKGLYLRALGGMCELAKRKNVYLYQEPFALHGFPQSMVASMKLMQSVKVANSPQGMDGRYTLDSMAPPEFERSLVKDVSLLFYIHGKDWETEEIHETVTKGFQQGYRMGMTINHAQQAYGFPKLI